MFITVIEYRFTYASILETIFWYFDESGDLAQRMCTAAEVKFYFNSFFSKESRTTHYMQPNKNCNLSSWVSGCEPGWACSVGRGEKVDMKNSETIPSRADDCAPCCEGFFCPHGLTCMIRKF